MSFPAGWYDDPRDLSAQRYWDGERWTEHRRPRSEHPPQAEASRQAEQAGSSGDGQQSRQGAVYPGPPPYHGPQYSGQQQAGPPHAGSQYAGQHANQPQYGGSQYTGQQYGNQQYGNQQYGAPQYGNQQQYGVQGQYPGAPMYPGQGFGYGPRVPATPDGMPLSGWWKRVWARLLDGIIVLVVSLPFAGYFWYQYLGAFLEYQRDLFDRAAAGQTTGFETTLPWEVYQWAIPATLISLAVNFVYEFFFLVRSGATPGKRALGISVRLRDVPGPPPALAVAKRFGLYAGLSVLGAVPVVGSLFGLLGLLNYLWPLWDDKKQALHDKVAHTNVVLGPQPRN